MISTNKVYKTLNAKENFVTITLTSQSKEEEKILDSIPLVSEYLSSEHKGLRNVQRHGNSFQFIASNN